MNTMKTEGVYVVPGGLGPRTWWKMYAASLNWTTWEERGQERERCFVAHPDL